MAQGSFPRRQFFRSATGGLLALPLLGGGIAGRTARAATAAAGPPKRLLIIYTANGAPLDDYFPGGSERDFTLSPILAPLAPHKQDLIILDGINNKAALSGDQHGAGLGTLLNGSKALPGRDFGVGRKSGGASARTIDQLIASRIGAMTKFGSLDFALKPARGNIFSRLSYTGPDQPVTPETDTALAFDRVFGALGGDTAELARLRVRRGSVLSRVVEQYRALVPRVSAADRKKVEAHLDAVADLEARIFKQAALGGSCARPARVDLGAGKEVTISKEGFNSTDAHDDRAVPQRFRAFRDIIVRAFACDLTRVATLMFSPARGEIVMSWLGITRGHHDITHAGGRSRPENVKINTWYASQVAETVAELKRIPEGNGTLFDNTLVFWANELANGYTHTLERLPWTLIGSAGGHFKTGRYLKYPGVLHNAVLVSICQAMGLADIQQVGNPEFGAGPLPRLTG